MSGSGLIYVAVLGAWAAFLLTRCLKTTPADTASGVEEGTLLRRRGASEPTANTFSMLRPLTDSAEPVVKPRAVDRPVELVTRARVSAATARRRRRMMGLLLGSFTLLAGATLIGLLPAWLAAVPGALFCAYLYEVRVQVRRSRVSEVRVPDAVPVARIPHPRGARSKPLDSDLTWNPWPETVAPPTGAALGDGWDPVPVPLPTYVTAPKAPARRIDLFAGRPWTDVDAEDTQEFPAMTDELIAQIEAEHAEVIDLDHKRAVGE